jgi:ABC-type nitrate/sulfonate/bicarbonate transport system substrate-binding protein
MTEPRSSALAVLVGAWLAVAGAAGCRDTQASNQAEGNAGAPAGEKPAAEAVRPAELRLDYATYNVSSVVLKRNGWLEQELARDGIGVRWVLSQGSNKANEMLASGSIDLASTSGASALLARSNGVPLKVVYVYARPAWTGVVVGAGSPIRSVAELRGAAELIASTRGLGFLLIDGENTARPQVMVVGILVLALLGKLSDTGLRLAARHAAWWSDGLEAR